MIERRRSRGRTASVAVGLIVVGLAACSGGDGGGGDGSTGAPLSDPCRVLSVTQRGRDMAAKYSLEAVEPPAPDGSPDLETCSWVGGDGEATEDYLDREATPFIDMAIRRSDPSTDFDAVTFFEAFAADPNAMERPELLTGADSGQADQAVSVGSSLFVLKGDVVLSVHTGSSRHLDELIPDPIARVVGGM